MGQKSLQSQSEKGESNKKPPLLNPIEVGGKVLKSRVVMAPLTRRRATADHIPTDLMVRYYEQRSSAGLIIAEATNISLQAVGYMNSPGIFNDKQIQAWKKVTHAVHEKNGVIFLQLWHVGRVSHSDLQPGKQQPVSASAIAASGDITTPAGPRSMEVPRALLVSEIQQVKQDYVNACLNAVEAGFDGIEIHGANGYLPDQFLHDSSNIRTDQYGGSIENRARFVLEITEGCCNAIGSDKVGIRLSPSGIFKDMFDSRPVDLFEYLISSLNKWDLVYLHLMEPYVALEPAERYVHYLHEVTPHFRNFWKGPLITNVDFDFDSANKIIEEGYADMVAFGKPFISNPDLVERFESGAALSPWDKDTFYHGGEKGYIDYPFLDG